MSKERVNEAREVIAKKQLALKFITQFIDKNESRLSKERWYVPTYGVTPAIHINSSCSTVEVAFEIARRWPELKWVRKGYCGVINWVAKTESVTLIIHHVIGRQPVRHDEAINLFPDQVDNKAGESGIENQTHQSEVKQ